MSFLQILWLNTQTKRWTLVQRIEVKCSKNNEKNHQRFWFWPCRVARQGIVSFSFLILLLLLETRLFHILPNIRFWPNLVTVTGTLTTTHVQTMMGSAIRMGSLESKRSFSPKRHQVLQNSYHWRVTYAHALAWPPSTKVMVLKNYQGSYGVTWIKRSFLLKMLSLVQFT